MSFAPTLQHRALAVACGVAVTLSGCTRWHDLEWSGRSPAAPLRSPLRVTKLDSSRVVVRAPRVTHDSLVGETEYNGRQVAIPMDSIHSVAGLRFNGTGTAFVVLGLGAVTAAALCLGVEGVCFSND